MIELRMLMFMPMIAGLLLFALPEKLKKIKAGLTILFSAIFLFLSIKVFGAENSITVMPCMQDIGAGELGVLNLDNLSKLIILFTGIFGFLYSIYSFAYITKEKKIYGYYSFYLITIGASNGAALADNLLFLLIFWGLLGLTLYKLIKGYDEKSSAAAKKSLILIGASDSIMIFGVGLLWVIGGSFSISGLMIDSSSWIASLAFICLLVGALTKAGAFPFHSWIPDFAETAPASSSSFLPASLDKLLGIYFLARICMNIFVFQPWMSMLLLIIGSITIIAAVMMALIQHNYKKLLGYHAVSQVGYMVLGFGLGTPLGIAGGLFHMINHALYKGGLFLSAGSVEKNTGKEDLDDLGGLAKVMPITFISALIFSFSISGIPPLNGFASKWMIYQGIIEFGKGAGLANNLWILWLALAVFGSALTLASFIKFISGIFLGRIRPEFEKLKEVSILMWLPKATIALLCILFGVFAAGYVVPGLITPAAGEFEYAGVWDSVTVSVLIILTLLLGIIAYIVLNKNNFRKDDSFLLGERTREQSSFPVLDFYKTIREFSFLSAIYKKAEDKWFDIYDVTKKGVFWFNNLFSKPHSGVLPTYVTWVVLGLIVLLLIL